MSGFKEIKASSVPTPTIKSDMKPFAHGVCRNIFFELLKYQMDPQTKSWKDWGSPRAKIADDDERREAVLRQVCGLSGWSEFCSYSQTEHTDDF